MPGKIAAFHVYLASPAQISVYPLPSTDKQSFDTMLEKFREQCVPTNTAYAPALMVESAAFNKLQLGATQSLEDFHSVIIEKARRLGKLNSDMLLQFTEGLPPSLAFFVRAGMANSLKAARIFVKSGDATGYRVNFPGSQCVPKVSAMKPSSMHSTEADELKEQVQQLRKIRRITFTSKLMRVAYHADPEVPVPVINVTVQETFSKSASNVKYATNTDMMRMVACDSRSQLLLIREQMHRVRIKPR